MANVLIEEQNLKDIADAIRSKLDSTKKMKVSQMKDLILSISGGGEKETITFTKGDIITIDFNKIGGIISSECEGDDEYKEIYKDNCSNGETLIIAKGPDSCLYLLYNPSGYYELSYRIKNTESRLSNSLNSHTSYPGTVGDLRQTLENAGKMNFEYDSNADLVLYKETDYMGLKFLDGEVSQLKAYNIFISKTEKGGDKDSYGPIDISHGDSFSVDFSYIAKIMDSYSLGNYYAVTETCTTKFSFIIARDHNGLELGAMIESPILYLYVKDGDDFKYIGEGSGNYLHHDPGEIGLWDLQLLLAAEGVVTFELDGISFKDLENDLTFICTDGHSLELSATEKNFVNRV